MSPTSDPADYVLYVDGACKGNPGPGGWGALIRNPATGSETELWGGAAQTTNNRMELCAAIEGISSCPDHSRLTVWTDSSYVQQGITSWIHGWKQKNWRKADGKPVVNADLWQQLDRLCPRYTIQWKWIKGHAGHEGNERADQLANRGVTDPEGGMAKTGTVTTGASEVFASGDSSQTAPAPEIVPAASFEPPATVVPAPKKGITRQLVLDTETTGFDPLRGDRIIEIGIVEYVNRRPTGEKVHIYFNPQRKVGDSVQVHGLTDEFLSDKDLFGDHAKLLFDYLQDGQIIAHNAGFDMSFLDAEFRRCKLPPISNHCEVIDTLVIARARHPGQKNSLDALVRRYDVTARDRTFHGALLDAEILADVYLALTGGQVSLDVSLETDGTGQTHVHATFSQQPVFVRPASEAEQAAHDNWCNEMEAGGKKPLFRTL